MLPRGEWPTYVSDIFAMANQGGEPIITVVLQLLTISAEELGRPYLTKEQRESPQN